MGRRENADEELASNGSRRKEKFWGQQ